MAKKSVSFRLEPVTVSQVKEMAELLQQSEAVVIESAVSAYYSRRKDIFEEQVKARAERFK